MIFYLSATGNSEWVARKLSEHFHEPLVSIAQELRRTGSELRYDVSGNERIFFVFPVHSWGPAVLVGRFVKRLRLVGYARQDVVSVCTCGDNCGNTDRMMARYLGRRGLSQTACYSVAMPNTYILMKGFGIDEPDVAEAKLRAAPARLDEIVRSIESGDPQAERLYERGTNPGLKSGWVYPLFRRFAIRRCKFLATEKCISCGLCVSVCPTGNIRLVDGSPRWGKDCVQCTACIHHCPVRAVEYGRVSLHQGRYLHPDRKVGARKDSGRIPQEKDA